jgi:hypothetical protein
MGLLSVVIRTYRPQYRPLSAIRYLDANPLSSRCTLFSTLLISKERYLVPCLYPKIAHVMRTPGQDKEPLGASSTKNQRDLPATTPIQDTHSRWLGVWEYAVYI